MLIGVPEQLIINDDDVPAWQILVPTDLLEFLRQCRLIWPMRRDTQWDRTHNCRNFDIVAAFDAVLSSG